MIRNLLILILLAVGIALLRWLVRDVVRAVSRSMGLSEQDGGAEGSAGGKAQGKGSQGSANRLVRDPVSGTYIDERVAVKEVIGGKTFYFESKENRDAYLRKSASA